MKKTHILTLEIETELNQADLASLFRVNVAERFKKEVAYTDENGVVGSGGIDIKQITALTIDATK